MEAVSSGLQKRVVHLRLRDIFMDERSIIDNYFLSNGIIICYQDNIFTSIHPFNESLHHYLVGKVHQINFTRLNEAIVQQITEMATSSELIFCKAVNTSELKSILEKEIINSEHKDKKATIYYLNLALQFLQQKLSEDITDVTKSIEIAPKIDDNTVMFSNSDDFTIISN